MIGGATKWMGSVIGERTDWRSFSSPLLRLSQPPPPLSRLTAERSLSLLLVLSLLTAEWPPMAGAYHPRRTLSYQGLCLPDHHWLIVIRKEEEGRRRTIQSWEIGGWQWWASGIEGVRKGVRMGSTRMRGSHYHATIFHRPHRSLRGRRGYNSRVNRLSIEIDTRRGG